MWFLKDSKDKSLCQGEIELESGYLRVECGNCTGPGTMESRRCFMGLSSRIEEGLSGNLVLASCEERFYSGQPLDTLFTSSEILQGLILIPDLASEEGLNNILRMKIRRFSKRALDIYRKDPAQFNERVEEMRRELSGICGGNPGLMRHWDSMTEKSSRMVKRTIRKAEDSGTNP